MKFATVLSVGFLLGALLFFALNPPLGDPGTPDGRPVVADVTPETRMASAQAETDAAVSRVLGFIDSTASGARPVVEPTTTPRYDRRQQAVQSLFQAIAFVESGYDDYAVGDGGDSLGRYQIQDPYFRDAVEHDPDLGRYTYREAATDEYVARCVMLAYWDRYCPKALRDADLETLARVHNGGPRGHLKKATDPYWEKVRQRLDPWDEGWYRQDLLAAR